jgi:phage terminase small subunit
VGELSFASRRACFDAEIGVHCVRRVGWRRKGVKTPKYLNQERNNSFRRNRGKIEFLRVAGLVSTLKSACTAFDAQNGVERAFKRRKISIKNEITVFVESEEILSFASRRACFDAEIGVHCVRRIKWSGKSIKTPQYLNQERNNSFRRNRRKIEFCELLGLYRR